MNQNSISGRFFDKKYRSKDKQSDSSPLRLMAALLVFMISTVTLYSASPATPNDNWKIVFDAGVDAPHNYSTSFTPKVWVYNQGGNPVIGASVSCTYTMVNDNTALPACSVVDNGDGSYSVVSGSRLNMPSYAGKYINIQFSVAAGSNTIREQHVYYAGQSNSAHGALWKVGVLSTSMGPSWNGNAAQKIYMNLYSDAGTPYRNNFNIPTITILRSTIGGQVNQQVVSKNIQRYMQAFILKPIMLREMNHHRR